MGVYRFNLLLMRSTMIAVSSAPAVTTERRIAPRLQPALGTVCRFNPPTDEHSPVVGLVWNISETGVSMLMAEMPERGETLSGELTLEAGGVGLPIALRIVHVRSVPTGDYFIGAQFVTPLEPSLLQRFLAPAIPTLKPPPPKG
jgi:hypothetical protein